MVLNVRGFYSILQEAEKLIASKIHPQTTILGWRKAVKVAQKALEKSAVDHGNDDDKFQEDLMNIARTTLSSKILVHQKDHFAKLAVDAVLRLKVLYLCWVELLTLYNLYKRCYVALQCLFSHASSICYLTSGIQRFPVSNKCILEIYIHELL